MGGGTGRCDTEITLFLADCTPTGKQESSSVERLSNILHNISNHSTYISVY